MHAIGSNPTAAAAGTTAAAAGTTPPLPPTLPPFQNLEGVFSGAVRFTGSGLSLWNVSAACTTLAHFADGATMFDADLTGWNVSRVTSMASGGD